MAEIEEHTGRHWCTDERDRLRLYWRGMRCPALRRLDPTVVRHPWAFVPLPPG